MDNSKFIVSILNGDSSTRSLKDILDDIRTEFNDISAIENEVVQNKINKW